MVVKTACLLHNILTSYGDLVYMPVGYADLPLPGGGVAEGTWRTETQQLEILQPHAPRNPVVQAKDIRKDLVAWISDAGARPWQDAHITRLG